MAEAVQHIAEVWASITGLDEPGLETIIMRSRFHRLKLNDIKRILKFYKKKGYILPPFKQNKDILLTNVSDIARFLKEYPDDATAFNLWKSNEEESDHSRSSSPQSQQPATVPAIPLPVSIPAMGSTNPALEAILSNPAKRAVFMELSRVSGVTSEEVIDAISGCDPNQLDPDVLLLDIVTKRTVRWAAPLDHLDRLRPPTRRLR